MEKQALPDVLQGLAGGLSDVGHRLSDVYSGLDPELRNAIVRGLAGAAIAGGGIGTLRALTPRDPEESVRSHVLKPALLAALLGGGAAAGLPAGINMMRGEHPFGGGPLSVSGTLTNAVASPVTHFPGAVAGGLLGAYPVLTKGLFSRLPKNVKPSVADTMRKDLRAAFGLGWQQERQAVDPALRAVRGWTPRTLTQPWNRADALRRMLKTVIERTTVAGRSAPLLGQAGVRTLPAVARILKPGQLAALGLIPAGMIAGHATQRLIRGD